MASVAQVRDRPSPQTTAATPTTAATAATATTEQQQHKQPKNPCRDMAHRLFSQRTRSERGTQKKGKGGWFSSLFGGRGGGGHEDPVAVAEVNAAPLNRSGVLVLKCCLCHFTHQTFGSDREPPHHHHDLRTTTIFSWSLFPSTFQIAKSAIANKRSNI
jgi:hypothetical protein